MKEFVVPECATPATFDEWEHTHVWVSGLMYVSAADVLALADDFPDRRIECERCDRTVAVLRAMTGPRPLHVIAADIRRDWGRKTYFGAVPYIAAMTGLTNITDDYGQDDGDYIVRYFLANANTWRGETARRVKAELRAMLG